MNRCVALRRRTRRVGVGPTRSRFDSRPQGALGSSLSCGDLDGCCLCANHPSCGVGGVRGRQRSPISMSAWDGPSRRAVHALSGPCVRSERYICGYVRCDAESRRAATARSGIIGLTISDASCCHRTPVGIRQVCGRLSAAKPLGSRLSCGDLDGCCLCAKLRGLWRPWPTAKRHFRVRMGRPFAASGAWAVRTWRAFRAICVCGCVRCAAESRRAGAARSGIIGLTIRDSSWLPSDGRPNAAGMRPTLRSEATRFQPLMR
jgi:hypothetical protein